jgi:hypothetical protein
MAGAFMQREILASADSFSFIKQKDEVSMPAPLHE